MTPRRKSEDAGPNQFWSCEELAEALDGADEQFQAGNYERVLSEFLNPLSIGEEGLRAISENCGPDLSRKYIELMGTSMLRSDEVVPRIASILIWQRGLVEASRQHDGRWQLSCIEGMAVASLWGEDDTLMNGAVGQYMLAPAYSRIHLQSSSQYDSPSVEELLAEIHHIGTNILEQRVSTTTAHEMLLKIAAEHRDKFFLEFDLTDGYNQGYLELLDSFVGSLANCGFDGEVKWLRIARRSENAELGLVRTILTRDPILGRMHLMPSRSDITEVLEREGDSEPTNLHWVVVDRGQVPPQN